MFQAHTSRSTICLLPPERSQACMTPGAVLWAHAAATSGAVACADTPAAGESAASKTNAARAEAEEATDQAEFLAERLDELEGELWETLADQPASKTEAAKILRGRVVAVTDGDTLTLLDDSKTQHRVRLLGIDAPEQKQPFGSRAKQALMQDAIQQLPEDYREALRLRYVENLPSKEIAAKLAKTDAAVRVMLTRSLRKLHC